MGYRSGCFGLIRIAVATLLLVAGISIISAYFIVHTFIRRESLDYITSPLLGSSLDFWDAPSDECSGVNTVLKKVDDARLAGIKPDLSAIVTGLPGHHAIRGGMRVRMINVRTIVCEGIIERFAHVRVTDERSPLFSHDGFITESRIMPAVR